MTQPSDKPEQTPEEIAEQRIAEALSSRAIELDLNGLALRTLPDSINQLQNLPILDFRENKLTALPEILIKFQSLSSLTIRENQLIALPEFIGQLQNLEILAVWNNQLTVLPESICQLQNLSKLVLFGNQLTALPDSIGLLKSLSELNLAKNQLSALPVSIALLRNLSKLDLGYNQFTVLPDSLVSLALAGNMQQFYLHGNKLGLPIEILGPSASHVNAAENKSLPEERQLKPQDPIRIGRYLKQLYSGPSRPLNEAKILVVGPGGHGKSSLIEYLRDGTFTKGKKNTEGVMVAPWFIADGAGSGDLRLNVWDFGGQEIQHSTHEFFLTQRAVYVLVFQPRDDQSVAQSLYYWIDLIHMIAPNAPVIVALSKQDEYEETVNDAADLKKLHPKIIDFISISCDSSHRCGKNVEHLRQVVLDTVYSDLEHIRYKLPATWYEPGTWVTGKPGT